MKRLILAGIAIGAGGVFIVVAEWPFTSRKMQISVGAAPTQAAPASPKTPPADNPQAIAIPETTITLRRDLQFKDSSGNIALALPAGATLITESTQGLEYIVVREGRTFRVHCDDASEPHGRFTDGRVEHLALRMAQEIRAEGKVPTNERIVTRATQALEDHKLAGDPSDLETQVDTLQRALLLQH